MKRTPFLSVLPVLLALLSACARPAAEPDPLPPVEAEELPSVQELAGAVLPVSGKGDALEVESLNREVDGERLAAYIEAVCGLTGERWEDAAVIRGTGASAFEIVVLRLEDGEAAEALEPVLADYLAAREGAFAGYAPAEADLASKGQVRREGRTLGVFICPDPETAAAAFTAACNGEALPAPVEPEPAEEAFTPPFELEDLLHRLLLEAACPEWRTVEKYWSVSEDGKSVYGYWAPDDGNGWTAGGVAELVLEDGRVTQLRTDMEYEVRVYLEDSEEEAQERAAALRRLAKDEEEKYRQRGDGIRTELLASAQAVSAGRYAALIVSDHTEDAVQLFPRIVNDPETGGYFRRYIDGLQPAKPADPDPDYPDRVRFVPPNEEDMSLYDTSAILAAWEKKDPSGLGGDNRAIYDAAEALLAEIMEEGMTGLEKEKAAYDWLVENVDYDWSHQDLLGETARRAFGPYGGLVDRSAVCLGYATSFQLLMDMSGVECITIVGAGNNSIMDHGWNMVRLNGEWYCTDVAWDANARELAGNHVWRYFNLTSGEMAKNHQWDYANTPEATAEDRGTPAAEQ